MAERRKGRITLDVVYEGPEVSQATAVLPGAWEVKPKAQDMLDAMGLDLRVTLATVETLRPAVGGPG